jgi:hypothetical protein
MQVLYHLKGFREGVVNVFDYIDSNPILLSAVNNQTQYAFLLALKVS